MSRFSAAVLVVVVGLFVAGAAQPVLAEADTPEPFFTEQDLSLTLNAMAADAMVAEAPTGEAGGAAPEGEPKAPAGKAPPMPLHTLEGTGGGVSSPMAYLVNPGPPGTEIGMPAFSTTFMKAGDKEVQSYAMSWTFYRRIEFSYAANRIHLGDWPKAVREQTPFHLSRNHVWVHNLNLRGMIIEETPQIPAVTAGVHFKINESVHAIDHRAGYAPRNLSGFERASDAEYTLSIAKTFPKLLFDRPVLTNFGLRWTRAAYAGWLGFGNEWNTNIEAHIAWVPTDWLAIAYEYKQMQSPYERVGTLVREEDDWHTVLVAWIINEHCTLAGAWGHLGAVVNHHEDCAWGVQFKYEF
ncbi:MAG: DUF3034 family protein [Planctomycetota bacterium]|nr:DUF3034 family protein [Planctomycetota bacterium]